MAPIYDSDIAEQRYSKAEWNHYELWEKVEVRIRRHKYLWIAGTAVVFIILSSIPIIVDQRPKWISLSATRQLAQELNWLKRDASLSRAAYRLRFAGDGKLTFVVEKAESCFSPSGTAIREGALLPEQHAGQFALMNRVQGEAAGVPGLTEAFCYDSLAGSEPAVRGEKASGFAVIPSEDLTNRRFDRLSVLVISGPSAEPSFE